MSSSTSNTHHQKRPLAYRRDPAPDFRPVVRDHELSSLALDPAEAAKFPDMDAWNFAVDPQYLHRGELTKHIDPRLLALDPNEAAIPAPNEQQSPKTCTESRARLEDPNEAANPVPNERQSPKTCAASQARLEDPSEAANPVSNKRKSSKTCAASQSRLEDPSEAANPVSKKRKSRKTCAASRDRLEDKNQVLQGEPSQQAPKKQPLQDAILFDLGALWAEQELQCCAAILSECVHLAQLAHDSSFKKAVVQAYHKLLAQDFLNHGNPGLENVKLFCAEIGKPEWGPQDMVFRFAIRYRLAASRMKSTMDELHAAGVCMAIVTREDRQVTEDVIRELRINDKLLNGVLYLVPDETPSKQDERLQKALADMKVTPEKTLMVGDDVQLLARARGCGIAPVSIRKPMNFFGQPAPVMRDLNDVLQFI